MKKILLLLLVSLSAETCAPYSNVEELPSKKRVLIGSPIRQKPAILQEFLLSLEELNHELFCADYMFIDDNDMAESSLLLEKFAQKHPSCSLISNENRHHSHEQYVCNETTHHWKESIIWKVAGFKDHIIQYALDNNYDYLFLIDSDIVLYPQTIDQLISDNKEIVSEIFWTRWVPESYKQPQVWLYDIYTQYETRYNEHLSNEEINQRHWHFLQIMATPGVYEIGGLGACTLISNSALQKGVNFKKIKNITFWGEDRHFCIRAAALGISMFVDTHYPAYHIYRESDLEGVAQFKENCKNGIYQI